MRRNGSWAKDGPRIELGHKGGNGLYWDKTPPITAVERPVPLYQARGANELGCSFCLKVDNEGSIPFAFSLLSMPAHEKMKEGYVTYRLANS